MTIDSSRGIQQVQQILDILEQGQKQSLDLAKKMIHISHQNAVSKNEAEGKGQILDVLA